MARSLTPRTANLIVRPLGRSRQRGVVQFGAWRLPCALGRSGISVRKREGDGATPRGRFGLVEVYYDPLRTRRPRTALPLHRTAADAGWCDAPGDRNYNRRVRLPYPASCETLRRSDGLYDVVVVLDYNLKPRRRGRGSAIFLHAARPGFAPTEGCVALRADDLRRVLAMAGRRAQLITSP